MEYVVPPKMAIVWARAALPFVSKSLGTFGEPSLEWKVVVIMIVTSDTPGCWMGRVADRHRRMLRGLEPLRARPYGAAVDTAR